jgi:hypothetical protein
VRFLLTGLVAVLAIGADPAAQTQATKDDTVRMSNQISQQTGIPTVAAVVPRGSTYDVKVTFGAAVTNYKGVMGVVIGAVGQATRTAKYPTQWCYISSPERGTERILTKDIQQVQSLALAHRLDESWAYFLKQKHKVLSETKR